MVGRHRWLSGHGFGWTLGVGDGQGGLMCCGSWGHKESDMTERVNWYWYWFGKFFISILLILVSEDFSCSFVWNIVLCFLIFLEFLLVLFKNIYLFIFGFTGFSLLHVDFLWLWQAEATFHCSLWTSHLRWLLLLWGSGSRCTTCSVLWALEYWLSSCGS